MQLVNLGAVNRCRFDRRIPGAIPGLHLAKDVVLLLAEGGKTDLVRVERVQCRERVDPRLGHDAAVLLGHPVLDVFGVVERLAVDQAHHVEVGTGDLGPFAKRERLRYRHGRVPQRRDARPLASHVVSLGKKLAHRRAPDHGRQCAVGRVDPVGQIGVAALELGPRPWPDEPRHSLGHPCLDGIDVVTDDLGVASCFPRSHVSCPCSGTSCLRRRGVRAVATAPSGGRRASRCSA